jgi:hypothetical protein
MAEEELEVQEPEEPDKVETLAKEFGWNPNYEGEDAISAEDFIRNTKGVNDALNRTVKSLKKEVSAVKAGVDAVKRSAEEAQKQKIAQLKTEIEDLKSKRREAIEDGRVDDVEALDDKIDSRKEAMAKKPEPNGPPPEFHEWLSQNSWYETNAEMQRYTDALIDVPELKALQVASPRKFFEKITEKVKEIFPEEFEDKKPEEPSTPQTPPVASGKQRGRPPKKKFTAKDLSYAERRVGSDFVAQGLFKSIDDYAQKLREGAA